MASALIPLVAGLAPGVIDLIASLVHPKAIAAEAKGAGTGPVKFADVFVATMGDLVKAKAAGQISDLPSEDIVKVITQSVVTSMKLSGVIGTAAAPTVAVAVPSGVGQTFQLRAGQSLLVSA